jgi:hypothetical protein
MIFGRRRCQETRVLLHFATVSRDQHGLGVMGPSPDGHNGVADPAISRVFLRFDLLPPSRVHKAIGAVSRGASSVHAVTGVSLMLQEDENGRFADAAR